MARSRYDVLRRLPSDAAELEEIARALRQSSPRADSATILHDLLSAASRITHTDMGNIQLVEGGALVIKAQVGFEKPFLDYFAVVSHGHFGCGAALEARRRIVVEDVANSMIFAGSPALEVMLAAGARACQSTPLISKSGEIIGMLSTHFREPRYLTDRECHLLDILAGLAGALIKLERRERRRPAC